MMSIFDDFYDDRDFEEDIVSPDIIQGLKVIAYNDSVEDYLEGVYRVMRTYYDVGKKVFWDDDIAREMMLMAFQRFLETGRLL